MESAVVNEVAGMWDLDLIDDCLVFFLTLTDIPAKSDYVRNFSYCLTKSLLLVLVSIGLVGDLIAILIFYIWRISATLFLMIILCSRTLISSSISKGRPSMLSIN